MRNDNRHWRKSLKKLQRSKRRKCKAIREQHSAAIMEDKETAEGDINSEDDILESLQHEADETAFWERERQSQLKFRAEQAEKAALLAERKAMEEKQRILDEEAKVRAEIKQVEKEEKLNALLGFLAGDIENPPVNFVMPEVSDEATSANEIETCLYYSRVGACRFYDRCRKLHPQPTLSSILLVENFFSYFHIQHGLHKMEYETDLTLEYEESDLYKEFLDFYNDVLHELQSVGNVVQFKVCCNFEPHMRGNVYIQYDSIREAVQAYRIFNGRFYNAKPVTVKFVKIPSWRQAICGQFIRKRCDKGKFCNYIHPFRNPNREFMAADNDWPDLSPKRAQRRNDRSRRNETSPDEKADLHETPEGSFCSTTSDPDKSTPEPSPGRTRCKRSIQMRNAPAEIKDTGSGSRHAVQNDLKPRSTGESRNQRSHSRDRHNDRRRSRNRSRSWSPDTRERCHKRDRTSSSHTSRYKDGSTSNTGSSTTRHHHRHHGSHSRPHSSHSHSHHKRSNRRNDTGTSHRSKVHTR